MSPSLTEVQGSTDKQLEESEGSPRGYVIGSYEEIPHPPTPHPTAPNPHPHPTLLFFLSSTSGTPVEEGVLMSLKSKEDGSNYSSRNYSNYSHCIILTARVILLQVSDARRGLR